MKLSFTFSFFKVFRHSLPFRSSPMFVISAEERPRREAETAAFGLFPTALIISNDSYGILSPKVTQSSRASVSIFE